MEMLLWAAAGAGLVAVVFAAVWWGVAGRTAVRRRVVANLVDGTAISGILLRRLGRLLVFVEASHLAPGMAEVQLDGEVFIERDRVSFMQAPFERGR